MGFFFIRRFSFKEKERKKKKDRYCCFDDCKQVAKLSSLLFPQIATVPHLCIVHVWEAESWKGLSPLRTSVSWLVSSTGQHFGRKPGQNCDFMTFFYQYVQECRDISQHSRQHSLLVWVSWASRASSHFLSSIRPQCYSKVVLIAEVRCGRGEKQTHKCPVPVFLQDCCTT